MAFISDNEFKRTQTQAEPDEAFVRLFSERTAEAFTGYADENFTVPNDPPNLVKVLQAAEMLVPGSVNLNHKHRHSDDNTFRKLLKAEGKPIGEDTIPEYRTAVDEFSESSREMLYPEYGADEVHQFPDHMKGIKKVLDLAADYGNEQEAGRPILNAAQQAQVEEALNAYDDIHSRTVKQKDFPERLKQFGAIYDTPHHTMLHNTHDAALGLFAEVSHLAHPPAAVEEDVGPQTAEEWAAAERMAAMAEEEFPPPEDATDVTVAPPPTTSTVTEATPTQPPKRGRGGKSSGKKKPK